MPDTLPHPSFADAVRDAFGGSPWRFLVGIVGIIAVFVVVGWLAHDPIAAWATGVVGDYGLGGITLASYAGEIIPPFGFQPALFLGYSGGVSTMVLYAAVVVGSFAASLTCWCIGAALRRSDRALAWLDRRSAALLFKRYGTTTVGIAALAPLPYGAITVLSGALGLPLKPALKGMLWRPVKIAFSLGLLVLGWSR